MVWEENRQDTYGKDEDGEIQSEEILGHEDCATAST